MSKPSLQELLQNVSEHRNDYFHYYRMFEALVKELEAQRPPQVDARIAKLTAERDSLKQRCEFADQAIAEAKTEIERLCDERVEDKTELGRLRDECKDAWHKLDEARAEIDRVRKERNGYRADLAEELRRRECLLLAKVAACDAEEAIRADAEIGRLVRGIENETGLHYCDGHYYALRFGWKAPRTMGYVPIAGSKSDDPTEALRAIQKVETDTRERTEKPYTTFQTLPSGERVEVASPGTQRGEA